MKTWLVVSMHHWKAVNWQIILACRTDGQTDRQTVLALFFASIIQPSTSNNGEKSKRELSLERSRAWSHVRLVINKIIAVINNDVVVSINLGLTLLVSTRLISHYSTGSNYMKCRRFCHLLWHTYRTAQRGPLLLVPNRISKGLFSWRWRKKRIRAYCNLLHIGSHCNAHSTNNGSEAFTIITVVEPALLSSNIVDILNAFTSSISSAFFTGQLLMILWYK